MRQRAADALISQSQPRTQNLGTIHSISRATRLSPITNVFWCTIIGSLRFEHFNFRLLGWLSECGCMHQGETATEGFHLHGTHVPSPREVGREPVWGKRQSARKWMISILNCHKPGSSKFNQCRNTLTYVYFKLERFLGLSNFALPLPKRQRPGSGRLSIILPTNFKRGYTASLYFQSFFPSISSETTLHNFSFYNYSHKLQTFHFGASITFYNYSPKLRTFHFGANITSYNYSPQIANVSVRRQHYFL